MESIRSGWGNARVPSCGEVDQAPTTEREMLRAWEAGDEAALERLISQHQRPLFGLCYGILRQAEDAEDAVQETFLRALRGLPQFRGEAAFRTWLFRIAVNLCLNWKRDYRPTTSWDEEQIRLLTPANSPETI